MLKLYSASVIFALHFSKLHKIYQIIPEQGNKTLNKAVKCILRESTVHEISISIGVHIYIDAGNTEAQTTSTCTAIPIKSKVHKTSLTYKHINSITNYYMLWHIYWLLYEVY